MRSSPGNAIGNGRQQAHAARLVSHVDEVYHRRARMPQRAPNRFISSSCENGTSRYPVPYHGTGPTAVEALPFTPQRARGPSRILTVPAFPLLTEDDTPLAFRLYPRKVNRPYETRGGCYGARFVSTVRSRSGLGGARSTPSLVLTSLSAGCL